MSLTFFISTPLPSGTAPGVHLGPPREGGSGGDGLELGALVLEQDPLALEWRCSGHAPPGRGGCGPRGSPRSPSHPACPPCSKGTSLVPWCLFFSQWHSLFFKVQTFQRNQSPLPERDPNTSLGALRPLPELSGLIRQGLGEIPHARGRCPLLSSCA